MIYEVEFTSKSREAARATAKQLIEQHVLTSASITPCDFLIADVGEAISEQYLVKVKGLTTTEAAQYISENYELKNLVLKIVEVDSDTAAKVSSWCNEETDVIEKPTISWAQARYNMNQNAAAWQEHRKAELMKKAERMRAVGNCQLQGPIPTTHPGMYYPDCAVAHDDNNNPIEIPEPSAEQMLDMVKTATPNVMFTHHAGVGIHTTEQKDDKGEQTDKNDDEQKERKVPQWAKDKGMSYADYKRYMNERTAARWGITYQEYSKLAAEARKSERPLKEYFEEHGLCYSEDLSEPEDEFDDGTEQCHKARELRDAEHAFDNWLLAVGLPLDCTVNTVYAAWCDKYGLTQNQRIIITNRDNPDESNFKTKLPQWAEKLGLTIPQYKLITRIGVAAQWGATLREYDDCYNSSKENGTTIENELAARFAKRSEKNLARHIAIEYRQLMNHITKLLNLYLEESDEQESLSDDEHNHLT